MKEREPVDVDGLGPANETDNSNSNREEFVGFVDEVSDEEDVYSKRANAKYPADCYSFLALHGPFEAPVFFFFGVMVWLFQV